MESFQRLSKPQKTMFNFTSPLEALERFKADYQFCNQKTFFLLHYLIFLSDEQNANHAIFLVIFFSHSTDEPKLVQIVC